MNNGEQPAFPRAGFEFTNLADNQRYEPTEGLTKREEFARTAMLGILSCPNRWLTDGNEVECNPDQVAGIALDYADALLSALEQKPETKWNTTE